jgi:hypothetical protein
VERLELGELHALACVAFTSNTQYNPDYEIKLKAGTS